MLPLHNMADGQQNQTFFENVRVSADCLLGTEGQAWNEVWFRIGGERLDAPGPVPDGHTYRTIRMLNDVIRYCRETKRGGVPLADDPLIRQKLGELIAGMEAIKLMAYEMYSNAFNPNPAANPILNTNMFMGYYKEFWPHMAQTYMEIAGPLSQLQDGKWAQLHGRMEHYFRASFGNHAGGTAQLKRMVMATRGLGLPR
jgi:alkylation response protein AidB-like acyl-CoA dehydrogenase